MICASMRCVIDDQFLFRSKPDEARFTTEAFTNDLFSSATEAFGKRISLQYVRSWSETFTSGSRIETGGATY